MKYIITILLFINISFSNSNSDFIKADNKKYFSASEEWCNKVKNFPSIYITKDLNEK